MFWHAIVGAAIVNCILSALIAWLSVRIIVLDVGDLSTGEFVTYKAVFGILLRLLVTPIVALWALSEADPVEP